MKKIKLIVLGSIVAVLLVIVLIIFFVDYLAKEGIEAGSP